MYYLFTWKINWRLEVMDKQPQRWREDSESKESIASVEDSKALFTYQGALCISKLKTLDIWLCIEHYELSIYCNLYFSKLGCDL